MIPIKAYKNYWLSIQTRLPLIKHVLFVYHEEDLSIKIRDIKANEIILVVLIPSSDAIQVDLDNLTDATTGLIYTVEKIDNRKGVSIVEEDVMERTQNMLKAVKYLMHLDATTCGNYMHEYLKGTNFNKLHIDPEDNYLGSYGWSMSFYIVDPFFTYDEDEYHDAYSLPPVTITDGLNVVEKDSGESYTCKYGNLPAVVRNSDGSYEGSVNAPDELVLPDTVFTDSDGGARQVPACVDIIATPHHGADVRNSDLSLNEHIDDGDARVLPDIAVQNSELTTIQTAPAAKNVSLADISFTDSDGVVATKPACKNITASPAYYGIEFDVTATSPTVTRTGNMTMHKLLPIQSGMRGCVLGDNGGVNYYFDPLDWSKKANGAASNRSGADGQVMIEIPAHYEAFGQIGNIAYARFSLVPLYGYTYIPILYISAYLATLQRSILKMASVLSSDADYRGGNNNAAWDGLSKTLIGKPLSALSRTNMRTYARNRGSVNWNILYYEAYKTLYWLFVCEFATRNSQAAVNASLTPEGYRQGGLGNGVTTAVSAEWNGFNGYYPFINCGASDSLGNGSGEVSVSVADFGGSGIARSFMVNRYHGIEMPFFLQNLDGANLKVQADSGGGESQLWTTSTPANFNDANYTNYVNRGLFARVNNYVKQVIMGNNGDIIPSVNNSAGADSAKYFCDYYYTSLPSSGEALRTLLVGGNAYTGSTAGFACSVSGYSPADSFTLIGCRLCYIGT